MLLLLLFLVLFLGRFFFLFLLLRSRTLKRSKRLRLLFLENCSLLVVFSTPSSLRPLITHRQIDWFCSVLLCSFVSAICPFVVVVFVLSIFCLPANVCQWADVAALKVIFSKKTVLVSPLEHHLHFFSQFPLPNCPNKSSSLPVTVY